MPARAACGRRLDHNGNHRLSLEQVNRLITISANQYGKISPEFTCIQLARRRIAFNQHDGGTEIVHGASRIAPFATRDALLRVPKRAPQMWLAIR